MPYDESLADRIRARLGTEDAIQEKRMFGGVGFLIRGNLAVGVHKDDLIVRVDPAQHNALLKRPGARPFALTGKPMAGWLLVSAKSLSSARDLHRWIGIAMRFVESLPGK